MSYMKTFAAEGYPKNETQGLDKFTKELTAMLDRTINRISQDTNRTEKIDQFFGQSSDYSASPVDNQRDHFSHLSALQNPRFQYGSSGTTEKNAYYGTQFNQMASQGYSLPGRFPNTQNEIKEDKLPNSMGTQNPNKSASALETQTQQMYQARQSQQAHPSYQRNQMAQATSPYQMATSQQPQASPQTGQSQAMQQRQQGNPFDASKQMNPMMQIQKGNQAPQGPQMVQNANNQKPQAGQSNNLLAKQTGQAAQSHIQMHEQDSSQRQKAQLQHQYPHLSQYPNMNIHMNPNLYQQQQQHQQQQQQQQQQQYQQQQHQQHPYSQLQQQQQQHLQQQQQQYLQSYQMNQQQMNPSHFMAMKPQQQQQQMQQHLQLQQQNQQQQQQQQQQQRQAHQQYNLNFARSASQDTQGSQAQTQTPSQNQAQTQVQVQAQAQAQAQTQGQGQTQAQSQNQTQAQAQAPTQAQVQAQAQAQAQAHKPTEQQQLYMNQFYQFGPNAQGGGIPENVQKQQQQYLNFMQKAAQSAQAGQAQQMMQNKDPQQQQHHQQQQFINQMFQMSPNTPNPQAAQMQQFKQKMQEQFNFSMSQDPKAYQAQQQMMQKPEQANIRPASQSSQTTAASQNPPKQTDQQSPSPSVNYNQQQATAAQKQQLNYMQQFALGAKGYPQQQMIQKAQEQSQAQTPVQAQAQAQSNITNQTSPSPISTNQKITQAQKQQQEQQKQNMHQGYQMLQGVQANNAMQMSDKKDITPANPFENPQAQQSASKNTTNATTPTHTPQLQQTRQNSQDAAGKFDITKCRQQIQQQMAQINHLQQMQQQQMTPQLQKQIQQAHYQLQQQLAQAHIQAQAHSQMPGQSPALTGQSQPNMNLFSHANIPLAKAQSHEPLQRAKSESLGSALKLDQEPEKEKEKMQVQAPEFSMPQSDPTKMIEIRRSESNPLKEKTQKVKQKKKQTIKRATSDKNEIKMMTEPSEKLELEPLNLYPTVPSTPGTNSMTVPEPPRKPEPKKQGSKLYEEMISIMKFLSEFDWLEENSLSHKLLPPKILTSTVVWFLICSDYFSRRDFLNRDVTQYIQDVFERIQSIMPEYMQRISKSSLKTELLQRPPVDELEFLIIESLGQGIRDYKQKEMSGEGFNAISSTRPPNPSPKLNYTEEDDQWLMETRRYIYDTFMQLQEEGVIPCLTYYDITRNLDLLSKIDLEDLITLYEKDLNVVVKENERNQENLKNNTLRTMEEEEMINNLEFDVNDTIADLKLTFPEDEKFISLMERRQNDIKTNNFEEKSASSRQGQKQEGQKTAQKCRTERVLEDAVCEICNDGDYSDEDQIVFCSRCNISVHQRCYGIPVIPRDDWVCDLCINFAENGKYLRCALCDKRGGAMKPSTTKADTDFFEYLNPDYHALISPNMLQGVSDKKPMTFRDLKRSKSIKTDLDFLRADEELVQTNNYHEKLYYDYHNVDEDKFTEEELKNEPVPSYVWVHITCVQYIPELYFGDKLQMTNVQGIEDIDRDRFRHECEVCKKKRRGAIVNCERGSCKKGFHPECARRAKQYLDSRENNQGQLIYHIYCDKHTPLQLRRMLEAKEKKKRDEVNKFFRAIEKYYMTYLSEPQSSGLSSGYGLFSSEPVSKIQKKRSFVTTTTMAQPKKEDFLKLVEKYKNKMCKEPCTITLRKAMEEALWESQQLFEIIDIQPPLDRDRELLADDDIWEVMPYRGMTPDQKYRKYKSLMSEAGKKTDDKDSKRTVEKLESSDILEPSEMKEASEVKDPLEISEMSEEFISDFRIDINSDPEFKMRLIKMSYVKYCTESSTMSLPFTLEYLAASLMVDDTSSSEAIVCQCKKPYRGEIILTCDRCKDRYHPRCVGMPENVNPDGFKWTCSPCLSNSFKQMAGNGYLHNPKQVAGLTSLIGKRPGSNESEEEPDLTKKINMGMNGRNYY